MFSITGKSWRMGTLLLVGLVWMRCSQFPLSPSSDRASSLTSPPPGGADPAPPATGGSPSTPPASPSPSSGEKSAASNPRILVDASRDGGVWWFPQGEAGFSANVPHQGTALVDYLKSRGFEVEELGRGVTVTDSLLSRYDKVIRAGEFGTYAEPELQAYERFLARQTSLVLISEFRRYDVTDELAERLGISFVGFVNGDITQFVEHPITQGVTPIPYIAGSVVGNVSSNPAIEILGRLSTGEPVMGILHHPTAKVFFLGEINGIEGVPQPFVSNLIAWAFE